MDLNQLRSFVAVAKLGHLTRAAETLHLSQPALSGQIKSLEEDFGVILFERSSAGMALTPSGRRLLKQAERVIGAVQDLKHSAQRLHGEPTGKITLGTVLEPGFLRVGELLARTFERHPQLELELHHVVSNDALVRVRSGALDASFYFGPQPEKDLRSIPLRQILYRVAMPIAWADELVNAPWDALAARPWVLAPEPSSHGRLVMDLFRERAATPARTIEADNESVIANLVESEVGISLVRDEIARESTGSGHSAIWPGATVTTQLWLVHPADRVEDPLLTALVEVLDEVWSAAETETDIA
jgi:DNA-binding transcriptional LysR family regulator